MWTWGEGDYGRLGHGDTLSRDSPKCVVDINNVGQVCHCLFCCNLISNKMTLHGTNYILNRGPILNFAMFCTSSNMQVLERAMTF